MNALFVLIFTCGGALAIGRGLDLALWTDWNTGLCTAGSVWLRYGGLWAALVVGIIAARKLARQPLVLRSACRPVGITSVLGGVCVGLAGAVRGTGASIPPMVVLLVSLCLFRIVWIQWVLPLFSGIEGVFILYPVSWGLGAVLMALYAWKGKWMEYHA